MKKLTLTVSGNISNLADIREFQKELLGVAAWLQDPGPLGNVADIPDLKAISTITYEITDEES